MQERKKAKCDQSYFHHLLPSSFFFYVFENFVYMSAHGDQKRALDPR